MGINLKIFCEGEVIKNVNRIMGITMLFFVSLVFTISYSATAQQEDSPSRILLTFTEPMSRESIFDVSNYEVRADESIHVKVMKVGVVEGDSAVVLFIQKERDWQNLQITVRNLKDKSGNIINDKKNFARITILLKSSDKIIPGNRSEGR